MASSTPSQPPVDAAYNISGNPIDQNKAERRHAESGDAANPANLVEARENGDIPVPSSHNGQPQPSSLGYGERTNAQDNTSGEFGVPNTEAEQMRPPGEGDVAVAQDTKHGFGEQMDLTSKVSDLDRIKAEQAPAREAMQQVRHN